MDVHRCRFVPYQPQSIDALAFSHASNPKQKTPKDLRLALGRQNGDIEIWNPSRGEWLQERILRGSVQRTIENLQWTQDLIFLDDEEQTGKVEHGPLRLFSSGGSTSITEWDLEKGVPKQHADGNADDIWCFAAQPQWAQNQARSNATEAQAAPSQLLAAGCADGTIILFSTADNELRFDRVLTRPHSKKSRCTSITWRDRNTIVAGFEESVIRVFDVRNKQTIRSLTLGKGREGDKPVVWAVKCLPNGTILSGDSLGELKIWDAHNFSLTQRLKAHGADVMDIATNSAGTMILTCGVDRRTVAYAPQSNSASSRTQRWHEIRHRRFHEHDVKAIAAYESNALSIAVSGGMDTVPVVVPLKNWNEEYHRSLPHLPQKPQMSVSHSERLMLTWWGRDLHIWQLPARYQEPADTDSVYDSRPSQKLLGGIQLKDEQHITSAAISSSGTMVVAGTAAGLKLFQIRRTTSPAGHGEVRSRPVELPRAMATQGVSTAGFSPDGKWLYAVRLNNIVSIVKITPGASSRDKPHVHERVIKLDRKRRMSPNLQRSGLGRYCEHINTVAISSDSRILAVGDLSGNVDTWILEGHESEMPVQKQPSKSDSESSSGGESDSDSDDETDSRVIHGQRWIRTPSGSQLPSLDSAVLALAFKPSPNAQPSARQISGNEGLHATRHTPHPVSHEHPPSEAGYLVAVTANHQVVMFDTLASRLAEWSRRNPSSQLPQSFKQIKDRTMGIWFDSRLDEHIDRLWLYGANFMYMLDLTQDLSVSRRQSNALVKVGRLGDHVLEAHPDHALVKSENDALNSKKRKRNMGAGDEMRDKQKYSAKLKRRDEDGNLEMGLLSPPRSVSEDIDDEDEDETMQDVHEDKRVSDVQANAEVATGPATWCTFRYRSIYGAFALAPDFKADDHDGTSVKTDSQLPTAPEVVVVERPTYEFELPPRFTDGREWD